MAPTSTPTPEQRCSSIYCEESQCWECSRSQAAAEKFARENKYTRETTVLYGVEVEVVTHHFIPTNTWDTWYTSECSNKKVDHSHPLTGGTFHFSSSPDEFERFEGQCTWCRRGEQPWMNMPYMQGVKAFR